MRLGDWFLPTANPVLHARFADEDLCRVERKITEGAMIQYVIDCLWRDTGGQDVAEYAMMLAIVLVLVTGMVRLIGANASTVFSQVGSKIQ